MGSLNDPNTHNEATPEEPHGDFTLRTLAMPANTNPAGDIFGGWLMGQMDNAGGIVARQHAAGRVATVAVDGFIFHKPVHVGDVVCCYTHVTEVGTTSVTVWVQGWALRGQVAQSRAKVTEVDFTCVALDKTRSQTPGNIDLGDQPASCHQEKRITRERQSHHGRKITKEGHCVHVPPSKRLV